ncbi:MAG: FecR domain-containing protein [Nitrospina sp.]|jgi:hypothetical protein|nr:FecR domain-containing protein [Nitrospina sp.]
MLRFVVLCASCLFISAHSFAIAQSAVVGRIQSFEHPFYITTVEGKKIDPELGYMITTGDQFATGEGGWVKYELTNEGTFKLEQNSQLTINEPIGVEEDLKRTDIQLVIGELLSKLKKIRKGPFVLRTASAVLGVRGTEFQTIVAIDATSMFVVDDGNVEIEAEGKKVIVPKGKMTQVEFEERPSSLQNALSKSERNWGQWRKGQQTIFFNKLRLVTDKINAGFTRQLDGINIFYDNLNRQAMSIDEEIEKLKTYKGKDRSDDMARPAEKLVFKMQSIEKMFNAYRNRLNHVRVMRKLSLRMEDFFKANTEKVAKSDLPSIQTNFLEISEKRSQIVSLENRAIDLLKDTHSRMDEIRDDIKALSGQKRKFRRKGYRGGNNE